MEGSLSLGEEIVGAAEKQQRAMTEEDHAEGMKMMFSDSTEDGSCESSTSSEASSGKYTLGSGGSEDDSVEHSVALCWRVRKVQLSNETVGDLKPYPSDKFRRTASDVEMMKERLSKLLLGEDMSGCGKGVCAALAISNAITNLCATVFGQLWRLEPLTPEKRSMWRREMEWLVCVSDHIVELVPSWQTLPNGRRLEVMTCRPRSDLYINLPALRKLDNMLLEILDSFSGSEFWYVDQGILAPDSDGSASFRRTLLRQEEKWWLPVPRVPPAGLLESTRKQLEHKRECTKQILKAALEINSSALADMDVPTSYLNSLPKNGRASLGDPIYRHIFSDQFSSEGLLDSLELSSEHQALEVANRVEAAIYIWRKQITGKPAGNRNCATAKPSWSMVKDMIAVDAEKRESLADRAEVLLLCLKQRFPALTQTALDMSKIQFNKDVGKSILESYSRVLESLAFNIIARIDELICVDDLSKHSSEGLLDPSCRTLHKNAPMLSYLVPPSGTPSCSSAYGTPNFSPAQLVSPASGERSALINRNSHNRSGFTVKKAITNYLSTEGKKL